MAKPSHPRKRNPLAKGHAEQRRWAPSTDEALLANITANVPVANFCRILRRDGTYAVLFSSAGTYEIFGRDPAKVEPDDLLDAIHPDDRQRWEELALESAASLTPLDFEMRARTATVETRWVRTVARPHADGRIEYPYTSPNLLDFLGLDPEVVARDAQLLADSTHPGDRACAPECYARSARDLSPVDMPRRMFNSTGAIKWVRTIARPEAGPDGAVV